MSLDPRFLSVLCCPVSKRSLLMLGATRIKFVNQQISAGTVLRVDGVAVSEPLREGLITDDAKVIYRIDDGIPVLLAEQAIGTTQFQDFPA